MTCIIYNNVYLRAQNFNHFFVLYLDIDRLRAAVKVGTYVYVCACVYMICICFSRVRSCLASVLTYVNALLHDNNSTKLSRRCMSSTDTRRRIPSIPIYCLSTFKVSWFLYVCNYYTVFHFIYLLINFFLTFSSNYANRVSRK